MKTISALLVFVAIAVCVAYGNESVSNQKQSNRESGRCGNAEWVLDTDTMTLTFSGSGILQKCSIPYYTQIKAAVINEGIVSIGEYVFEDWIELSSVSLPDSLSVIENNAFRNTSLTSFHIPRLMNSFDGCAFWDCKKLSTFTVDVNNSKYIVEDNVVFDSNKTTIVRYAPGQPLKKYDIPNGVITVDKCCFQSSFNLKRVGIPDSVRTLGRYSFHRMGIRSSIIPASVTDVGGYAFCYNDNLTNVKYLGNSDPGSPDDPFCECPNLTEICVEPSYTSSSCCGKSINSTCADPSFDSSSLGSGSSSSGSASLASAVTRIPSFAFTLVVFIICILF